MSGVFGAVDTNHNSDVRALAKKMAAAMSHRDWYEADHYVNEHNNVATGRIGIGIFNNRPQPVVDDSGSRILFMSGEIHNRDSLSNGNPSIPDEVLILKLYEQEGDNFLSKIQGAFVIAIIDLKINKMLIFNDRFGLYPLFYTNRAGRLIFAPEMKGILCDDKFTKKIDFTALAQYVRFQQLLGVRTFFEDIQVLPPASILTFDLTSGSCSTRTYWSFSDIPYNPQISIDEAIEETARLLDKAIKTRSNGDYRPGVFLSGGLDSRMILGMIEHRPIATLTFGRRDCRDVIYGKQIAKAAGSDHYWIDLSNGDWIQKHFDFHLELIEGFNSWIHAHGISGLPIAKEVMEVNLTGMGGGTIMGKHFIQPRLYSSVDDSALTSYFFFIFNQKHTWPSITEAEEQLLFSQPVRNQLQGLAFDSFREELEPYLDYRHDVKSEYFYLHNHELRFISNYVTFIRSHVDVRIPFYDYDLFEFLYSLPAVYRLDKGIYLPVMQKMLPKLSYIPYERDELLPTTNSMARNSHAVLVKMKRRFNRHITKVFPEYHTLYADYENYLRHELRDWAEDILYDKRTASREIFDSSYLHTLMNRHLSGMEEATIGKIAPLITYEMMLRRYYD